MVDSTEHGREPSPSDLPMPPILRALASSLVEVVGPEAAEEALFRLGRRLGAQEAAAHGAQGEPEDPLGRAKAWVRRLGLAEIELQPVEVDPDGAPPRLVGQVLDPGRVDAEPSLCALTAGFFAGAAGRVAGLDLVGSELHCEGECPDKGCDVELLAADRGDWPRSVNGIARFYLPAMGGSLGESEISLAELVESTQDAIILIDHDDVIRFWSRGAERMFQYPREEVVGERIGFLVPMDLIAQDELGQFQAALDREGVVLNQETRRVRRDGVELNVSLTRTVLLDGNQRPIGSTAIIRDVTELRSKEDELLATRTLAVLGRLAAKVAHEIKNPLAGISGAIQVLRRGLPPEHPRAQVYEDILLEVGRLDDTVRDLLRFARPIPPKPTATDLRTFVENLVESLGCRHELADHRLELDLPSELIVPLDSKLMEPVLSNLLHNATQAMAQAGTIRVRAQCQGNHVRIEVEDEGQGVSDDAVAHLFEPFFTTKSRGTGLGLAIARKNVELHGGRLEFDSDYDLGARFSISLPLAPADPVESADA